jgi:hypothetical protein
VVDILRLAIIEQEPLIRNCEDCLQMVQEAQKDHESINDKLGRRRRSIK